MDFKITTNLHPFIPNYAHNHFNLDFINKSINNQSNLTKKYQTKFENGRSRHSRVIELLVTLTFDPVTPVSIAFLCYLRWMCGQSLRKVGQDVLELLIGNKKVTDRQTNRPSKAICPLFFEGGHNEYTALVSSPHLPMSCTCRLIWSYIFTQSYTYLLAALCSYKCLA